LKNKFLIEGVKKKISSLLK